MYNFSWQLRAFCAAGFALFLSCTPEPFAEPACLGGNCTAVIKPIVENSTYTFDIDESNSKIQYFTVEVHATPTSEEWRYNGVPVVSAYWSGDLTYFVQTPYTLDEVNSADRETFGRFEGNRVIITQIIGVRSSQSGKTLNLSVDVWWDAGIETQSKKYFQKIMLK
tara:strand:- start:3268 stop:3765 length:498 start_codon:yes stop_codon:yes gene_type:complete